jgi:hypothetical protein
MAWKSCCLLLANMRLVATNEGGITTVKMAKASLERAGLSARAQASPKRLIRFLPFERNLSAADYRYE